MAAQELYTTSLFSDANLVAYYRLENVNDSKNSYNLTNTNSAGFSAAKFNNGVDFGLANTNKSLRITNNLGIGSGAISIVGWINVTTAPTIGTLVFPFRHDDDVTHVANAIQYRNDAGTLYLNPIRTRFGTANDTNTFAYTLTPGTWYHLAYVYDGSKVYFYVNGVSQGTPPSSSGGGSSGGDGTEFAIGAWENSGDYLSGLMDDVAVFNRALTATEIYNLAGSSLSNNLIVNYRMEGNSNDNGGSAYNGTDTAMTYGITYGKITQGANFNGSSSYISLPNNMSGLTGDLTVNAWINFTSLVVNADFRGIVTRLDSSPNFGFAFQLGRDDARGTPPYYTSRVYISGTGSNLEDHYVSYPTPSTGTWYMVTFVWTAASHKLEQFWNASSQGTDTTGTITNINNNSKNVYIGATNATAPINGNLDEVSLWSRALSSTEITQLYNGGAGMFFSGAQFVSPLGGALFMGAGL